jgi:hypothetical protein
MGAEMHRTRRTHRTGTARVPVTHGQTGCLGEHPDRPCDVGCHPWLGRLDDRERRLDATLQRALCGGRQGADRTQIQAASMIAMADQCAEAKEAPMISGVHAIVFSPAAEEVRAFFRDTLGLASVDAGGGWPIFALPPAELAVHPGDDARHELYLMADDLDATVARLAERGVSLATPITRQSWGRVSAIRLAGGTEIGLYEPSHRRPASRS